MPERKPIFYDEQRRRWRRTRRVLELAGGFFTIVLVIFVVNLIRNPDLPDILRADTHGTLHAVSPDGHLDLDQDPKLLNWLQSIKAKGVELPIMSMVNNYDGKDWKIDEMAQMLSHPAAREKLVKALVAFANSDHEPGLVVDFEEVPKESQENFQAFIHELAGALHAANLKLMVALPAADWTFDYKYFGSQADAIILMNYDFHWPASPPGPVVSQDWFVRNINNILKLVPPEKIV